MNRKATCSWSFMFKQKTQKERKNERRLIINVKKHKILKLGIKTKEHKQTKMSCLKEPLNY